MFSPEARKEAPASERAVEKSLPSGRVWEKEIWISRARTPAAFEASGSREREPRPARALWEFTRASTWARGSLLPAPGRRRQFRVNHCFPGRPAVPETGERLAVPGSEEYPAIPVPGVWTAFRTYGETDQARKSWKGFPPPGQGRKKRRPHGPGAARYGSWAAWEESGAAPAADRTAAAVIA